jgi:hypothetical protein
VIGQAIARDRTQEKVGCSKSDSPSWRNSQNERTSRQVVLVGFHASGLLLFMETEAGLVPSLYLPQTVVPPEWYEEVPRSVD